MSTNIAEYEPALRYKTITTTTWGAGGNTFTLTDPKITTNSDVRIWVTGTTAAAGRWAVVYNQGNAVFTSSSSENTALPLAYYIQ